MDIVDIVPGYTVCLDGVIDTSAETRLTTSPVCWDSSDGAAVSVGSGAGCTGGGIGCTGTEDGLSGVGLLHPATTDINIQRHTKIDIL